MPKRVHCTCCDKAPANWWLRSTWSGQPDLDESWIEPMINPLQRFPWRKDKTVTVRLYQSDHYIKQRGMNITINIKKIVKQMEQIRSWPAYPKLRDWFLDNAKLHPLLFGWLQLLPSETPQPHLVLYVNDIGSNQYTYIHIVIVEYFGADTDMPDIWWPSIPAVACMCKNKYILYIYIYIFTYIYI